MPDDLTAALAEIRDRGYRNGASGVTAARLSDCADTDIPRLLAALDAVLAGHQPGRIAIVGELCQQHATHRFFSITRTEADNVTGCPDCRAVAYDSCAGCGTSVRLDRCPLRSAITRALTGGTDD